MEPEMGLWHDAIYEAGKFSGHVDAMGIALATSVVAVVSALVIFALGHGETARTVLLVGYGACWSSLVLAATSCRAGQIAKTTLNHADHVRSMTNGA